VGEHGGDVEAARALDIHEVAVGALDQALELVLAGLSLGVGVKEILALLHQYEGAHEFSAEVRKHDAPQKSSSIFPQAG
jgi:hypothetical protein